MDANPHALAVYLNLSRASQRRQRPMVRDRMLLLAGMEAARLQFHQLSQYCRSIILENNPKHFVGRWDSIAKGMLDEKFARLTAPIKKRYPLERAEQMLQTLGIDISNERATYFDDVEYAASILDVDISLVSDTRDELEP